MAKARFKLILGRRKNYPLHLELEVYKNADCRVLISTGIVLESEKQWDSDRQLIIKCKNETQYNRFLQQMIQNIMDVETEIERRGDVLTPDAIKLAAKSQTARGEDVFETFERYISEQKNIKESTKQCQIGFVRMFRRFVRHHKSNNKATLFFGEVSLNLIKAAELYMFDRGEARLHIIFPLYHKEILEESQEGGPDWQQPIRQL